MAVMIECPLCHLRQSLKNQKKRQCRGCPSKLASKYVRYWANFRIGGKQTWMGPYATKDDAQAAHDQAVIDRRKGKLTPQVELAWTVGDAIGYFLEKLPETKTIATYGDVCCLLNKVKEALGHRRLVELGLTDLQAYAQQCRNAGLAPATIDKRMIYLKASIEMAFYDGKVGHHVLRPFGKLEKQLKRGSNARLRELTMEQLAALLDAATDHFRQLLITEYYTGMRAGELRGLRWGMIDKELTMIRLPRELLKEGRHLQKGATKNIPVAPAVKKALLAAKWYNRVHGTGDKPGDPVFTHRGKSYRQSFWVAFERTCHRAGVPYGRDVDGAVVFHDLRSNVKTNMADAGLRKHHRDALLGHASEGMDRHYLQKRESELVDAMDKFAAYMDRKLENVTKIVTKPTGTDA